MMATKSVVSTRLVQRAKEITAAETEKYSARTPVSQAQYHRAEKSLPMGVPSSFQFYDPHPVVAKRARGSRLEDIDGNQYIDFNMGYGALFVGHLHPLVVAAVTRQLEEGTLFVTPCESNADVAENLAARFGLPSWRFTNSGTEATMDAIRVARAFTGRNKLVKVEGGYHGHHDEVMVSMKPPLDKAGPANRPQGVPATKGLTVHILEDTLVIPYNDPEALDRMLGRGDIAAFIVEPVMENIGICLPQPGYLEEVRRITRKHGVMLIFDEVKTGITAGWGGATRRFGVEPDLVCLAKSIGGGLPVGAFGGRKEVMNLVGDGSVLHLGTYNGNPLVMAACQAVLGEILTPLVIDEAFARNKLMLAGCQAVIDQYDLPAHTVEMGAKGCITWSREKVKNYRDYKNTDLTIAYAQWIWGINRGILLPPGLDEQWLISVQHTDLDVAHHTDVFAGFAEALTA